MHHVIMDCPRPAVLAEFYSELLGRPVTYVDEDFAVVAVDATSSGLGFQRAPDHRPPAWPDPARPQQMHLDVMVDDPAAAVPAVIALGARLLTPDQGQYVFADPAGHPFCLIPRPSWAPPVHAPGSPTSEPAPLPTTGPPTGAHRTSTEPGWY